MLLLDVRFVQTNFWQGDRPAPVCSENPKSDHSGDEVPPRTARELMTPARATIAVTSETLQVRLRRQSGSVRSGARPDGAVSSPSVDAGVILPRSAV
jgi:hypothetical protein